MNGPRPLPTKENLKAEAKRLRAQHESEGRAIGHSRSLELLARQYGYRDWNTLHAAAEHRRTPDCPVCLGGRVAGRYLSQPFDGEVIGVRSLGQSGRYRVTFRFDRPVDVVTFDSFSAFRQRVSCIIDRRGKTAEKTSDGRPQLELQL